MSAPWWSLGSEPPWSWSAQSQNIISKAEAERPPGVDTTFIQKVQSERQAYLEAHGAQATQRNEGKMSRGAHEERLGTAQELQYAADGLWPADRAESAQARSDFQLPAQRPYSY